MAFQLEEIRKEMALTRDLAQLRQLRDRIHKELSDDSLTSAPVDWNDWVNTIHDDLIRIAVKQAEERMITEGLGSPPVPYAMLVFGSGGRREQTLWSDQDNGLIYEDPIQEHKERVQHYFHQFSHWIVENLFQLGYPACEGNVMCHNPQWGRSETEWKQLLQDWVKERDWEHIRYLLISADTRCIYGESKLAQQIGELIVHHTTTVAPLMGAMLRNTLRRKVSLGVLGNLIPERFGEDMGGIDIKYGAYIPLVNGIRLLAIRYRIHNTNTLERIAALESGGYITQTVAAEWRGAFLTVLQLRSLTSYKLEEGQYQSSGILPGALLTKERKKLLKAALRTAQKLHKYVEKEIHLMESDKE